MPSRTFGAHPHCLFTAHPSQLNQVHMYVLVISRDEMMRFSDVQKTPVSMVCLSDLVLQMQATTGCISCASAEASESTERSTSLPTSTRLPLTLDSSHRPLSSPCSLASHGLGMPLVYVAPAQTRCCQRIPASPISQGETSAQPPSVVISYRIATKAILT